MDEQPAIRRLLHIEGEPKPWREQGQSTCGQDVPPEHLAEPTLRRPRDSDMRTIRGKRGRWITVMTHQGQLRKVCEDCLHGRLKGDEREED